MRSGLVGVERPVKPRTGSARLAVPARGSMEE